ncbi:MAG: hypothetical protein ACKPKO_20020, partial [Candidatus Fonsibacter sp.]
SRTSDEVGGVHARGDAVVPRAVIDPVENVFSKMAAPRASAVDQVTNFLSALLGPNASHHREAHGGGQLVLPSLPYLGDGPLGIGEVHGPSDALAHVVKRSLLPEEGSKGVPDGLQEGSVVPA